MSLNKSKKIVILISLLLLSSCSLLSPIKTEPNRTYFIESIPTNIPRHKTHAATILVLMPSTQPAFDTTRMAYTDKPYQIAYFGVNQWAETPSQMLQPLIVQTLMNTHYYKAVVMPPYSGNFDYLLRTQILQLQQDFTHNPPQLRLTLRAQLSRGATNAIIGTKQFSINEPIDRKSPYGGVIAANRATAIMLQELARFCVELDHGKR